MQYGLQWYGSRNCDALTQKVHLYASPRSPPPQKRRIGDRHLDESIAIKLAHRFCQPDSLSARQNRVCSTYALGRRYFLPFHALFPAGVGVVPEAHSAISNSSTAYPPRSQARHRLSGANAPSQPNNPRFDCSLRASPARTDARDNPSHEHTSALAARTDDAETGRIAWTTTRASRRRPAQSDALLADRKRFFSKRP